MKIHPGLQSMKPPQLDIPFVGLISPKEARSLAVRSGMRQAAQRGVHIGRLSQPLEVFALKPSTLEAKRALAGGLSLRKAAKKAGVSVNSIRKVKALSQPTLF